MNMTWSETSTKRRVRELSFVFAVVVALVLFSTAGSARPQKEKKTGAAKSVFAADKGTLRILLDGQPVGTEEFEITSSDKAWLARGSTEIHPAGAASTRVKSSLRLQPGGAPESYEWSFQGERKAGAKVTFQDGIAKTTLQFEQAKPFEQELTFGSPMIAVLDNNVYHHYAILARVYDWGRKGAQTFPVLIPQDMTPGTITVEAGGVQTVGGKQFDTLKVTTADLEVRLFLDSNHRLMRLEVPASKVIVTRD